MEKEFELTQTGSHRHLVLQLRSLRFDRCLVLRNQNQRRKNRDLLGFQRVETPRCCLRILQLHPFKKRDEEDSEGSALNLDSDIGKRNSCSRRRKLVGRGLGIPVPSEASVSSSTSSARLLPSKGARVVVGVLRSTRRSVGVGVGIGVEGPEEKERRDGKR